MSVSLENSGPMLVVRCAIQDPKDRLLIVRRIKKANHNAGLWEFPGGKTDAGERLGETMLREIGEEVGLEVEQTEPYQFVGDRIINDGPYRGRLYALWCGVGRIRQERDTRLSNEHAAAIWTPYPTALEYELTVETRESAAMLEPFLLTQNNS